MAATAHPNALAPAKTGDQTHGRTYSKTRDSRTTRDGTHTTTLTLPQPPTVPPPTLQKHSYSPTGRHPPTPHDSANTLFPDQTHPFDGHLHKPASMSSSASNSFAMTPISSNELEKSSVSTKGSSSASSSSHHHPSRKSSSNRDPEKSERRRSDHHHHHHHPRRSHPRSVDRGLTTSHLRYARDPEAGGSPFHDADDDAEEQRRLHEPHAGRILLFLAFPCVVLSLLNAVWTLVSLLVTALAQPVRLCARRPGFGQQLGGLVGPALNLQLRGVRTPLPPHADDDGAYRPLVLVAVMLLSPFLAFGMMVAAWVVAVFWLTSAMIGDPVGLDRRDDGRDTVLALRRWWERWLVRSMSDD